MCTATGRNLQQHTHLLADVISLNTRVDAPSWSRALTSAGLVIYAGNLWGMPYTIGPSGSNQNVISLKGHS